MSRSRYAEIGGVELDAPPAIALRAARDDDLHDAVGDAVDVASRVIGIFGDRDPREAVSRLVADRRLQGEIEDSATRLWDAVVEVVTPPRRRRRRWVLVAAALAIAAGVACVVVKKRCGGAGNADEQAPNAAAGMAEAGGAR